MEYRSFMWQPIIDLEARNGQNIDIIIDCPTTSILYVIILFLCNCNYSIFQITNHEINKDYILLITIIFQLACKLWGLLSGKIFDGLINCQFRFIFFLFQFGWGWWLLQKIPNSAKFHFKTEQNKCTCQCLIFWKYSSSSSDEKVIYIPIFYTNNVFQLQIAITLQRREQEIWGFF